MCEFELKKKMTVDETVDDIDKDGKPIKVTKPVEKDIPHKFYLQQPTRSQKDASATFFAASVSKLANEGILTKPMLRRLILNAGGSLSEPERKEATELYDQMFEKTNTYTRLHAIEESKKTAEEKTKLTEVTKELLELQQKVQAFEQSQAALFEICCESLAKNKTILWNLVFLSYQDSPDKKTQSPFFGEGDLEKRLDRLDEIEESDDIFLKQAKDELLLYTSIHFEGIARTPAEFKAVRERI